MNVEFACLKSIRALDLYFSIHLHDARSACFVYYEIIVILL